MERVLGAVRTSTIAIIDEGTMTCPFFQLSPNTDIETLLDMPLSHLSASYSSTSFSSVSNSGVSIKSFKSLPSSLSTNGPGLDPASKGLKVNTEEDHAELSNQLDKLLIEDKRFFGQAR